MKSLISTFSARGCCLGGKRRQFPATRGLWTVLILAGVLGTLMSAPARAGDLCHFEDLERAAILQAHSLGREPQELTGTPLVSSLTRTPVLGDVVAYSVLVRVGPGEHDVIRLHRVVRERRPCVPIRTPQSVFLLHGAQVDFRTSFLGSTVSTQVPREQSIGVFLAQRDIDVWGLDMRSTLVPVDTGDFSFMQNWSYATDIQDLSISLAIARSVRGLSGSGFGKMILLGWSNGGTIAYAYVNHETRFPKRLRHVKGLIPVDIALKYGPADESLRQAACKRATVLQGLLEARLFVVDNTRAKPAGFLAATAPNAPSPFAPQFTNRTAALLSAAATWAVNFSPAFPPFTPFFHFLAGQFDPVSQLPIDLTYTRAPYSFDLLQALPPWWVRREAFEQNALSCNEVDLPYDDHLAEVKVPVLYVGAEGGFGHAGEYAATLLGSTDVTTHIVTLLPQSSLDFGHSDLFWADNAQTVAWEPIYNWIESH